jgi:hypothetical protein
LQVAPFGGVATHAPDGAPFAVQQCDAEAGQFPL